MKNKLSITGAILAIAYAVLSVVGCSGTPIVQMNHDNSGTFGEALTLPVKDFVSMGLVFTEVQLQVTSNGPINGDVFTYQALLKEAKKVGADAIINVTIDRTEMVTTTTDVLGGNSEVKRETWYGSALAIRYTDALKEGHLVQRTIIVPATAPEPPPKKKEFFGF